MMDLYELAGRNPDLRFSPYCWRVRMALAHKGLEARTIPWHFGEKLLPEGLTQVPVLVDEGDVISDSWRIAQHLEENYTNGPSLFGGCEAHVRFIAAWTDTVLIPGLFPLVAADLLRQVRPEAVAYFRETREKRLGMSIEAAAAQRGERLPAVRAALSPVRRVLESAAFIGGEEPSFGDYAVFGAFQWVRVASGFEVLAEDDPVFAWRERMLELFDGLAAEAETV